MTLFYGVLQTAFERYMGICFRVYQIDYCHFLVLV